MTTDELTALMLRTPLSCAFFLLAQNAGLNASQLCRPDIALDLAAQARRELDPWLHNAEQARQEVIALAKGRIEQLVRTTLADPDARWWYEPLRLKRQLWVGSSNDSALRIVEPTGEPTRFEAYAQRPQPWLITSTEFDGRTGLHATLAHQVGDWEPTYPLHQFRLNLAEPARVYEINSAEDWHNLAVRYGPLTSTTDTPSDTHDMISGEPPVWSKVARDWDAIHLTFSGFLAAIYVPAGKVTKTTTLWTWDCEQTLWLHELAISWTELTPLRDRPEPMFGTIPLQLHATGAGHSAAAAWLREA